jgi:hypothetical protein
VIGGIDRLLDIDDEQTGIGEQRRQRVSPAESSVTESNRVLGCKRSHRLP